MLSKIQQNFPTTLTPFAIINTEQGVIAGEFGKKGLKIKAEIAKTKHYITLHINGDDMTKLIKVVIFFVGLNQTLSFASPFLDAVARKDLKEVERLLDYEEVDINEVNNEGNFALLILAASGGDISILQKLLERGANIDRQNPNQMTALIGAVNANNGHIVEELIKHGAKTYLQDKHHRTALYYALRKGKPGDPNQKLIEILIPLVKESSIANQVKVVDKDEVRLLDEGVPGSYDREFLAHGPKEQRNAQIEESTGIRIDNGPGKLILQYLGQ